MDKNLERENKIHEYIQSPGYIPLSPYELMFVFNVPESDKKLFFSIIEKLVDEKAVGVSKKGRLIPVLEPLTGTLTAVSGGSCIFSCNNGEIFIPAKNLNGAHHKDTVIVNKIDNAAGGMRAVGKVVKIIKHGMKLIPATFKLSNNRSIAIPDEKRADFEIFIPRKKRGGAEPGQKVLVEIEGYDDNTPKGRVTKILGNPGDKAAEILSIIIQNDIPYMFPEDVLNAADSVPNSVSPQDCLGRKDFRNMLMITIDGEDTKDFDDAVTIEKTETGYILGVHIADVAHYVKENSPLDKEALVRGNSVYLPDRVIPMLPFQLSNGICSLIAGVERLALSCVMELNTDGAVINHSLVESVININKRFTYNEVTSIVEREDRALIEQNQEYMEMFDTMAELASILSANREMRGAIDFDVPECKIIIDGNGSVAKIDLYKRNVATKIIEEFMVLCNETVAEQFFWSETPFVFRTHEPPVSEKIDSLSEFLRNFRRTVKGRKNAALHPKALQKVLLDVKGAPEERIVSRSILRTMKQARYSPDNKGHFGLALKYYCHFTSPIRRYADLQIHRIIKESINNEITQERLERLRAKTEDASAHISKTERMAENVEREVEKLKKCEYMSEKIGMTFEGIISYVAKYGIYVELPDTVEGMIPLSLMDDDHYIIDEENMRAVGKKQGKIYSLGDKVKIKVKYVSIKDRIIDFIFV